MSGPEPAGWSSLPSRLSPISGGVVIALTATTWLQKTYEASPVDVTRTYTLWGLLATVNHRLLFLLIIAIALILASAVAGIAGAILTLVVCTVTALVTSLAPLLRPRKVASPD